MAQERCYGCMQLKNQSPVCEHCGFNEHVPNESHQLPCGTVLRGQYLIGKVLGQGGFGITYMGWDLNLEMPIAIKEYYPNGVVTRESVFSPTVMLSRKDMENSYRMNKERFLREARALARLRDIPEVVHVYNFFEENNTAYIIMEYIRGTDLRHYIRQRGGRLTAQESLSLLQPVMQALEKVHEAELVHRDISPDNIMLLPGGKTKLLDFGAVREVADADAERALSNSTEAILKHGFAPMEQYQTRGSLGPWTDVYALCGTLYYCMTGKVPPEAPTRMMEDEHPQWEAVPGLNDRQRRILAAGMALRAKDRIASVKHLRQELYAAAGEQSAPQPVPQPVPAPAKQTAYPVGTLSLEEEPAVFQKAQSVQKQPLYTVPVQKKPVYTTPVQKPAAAKAAPRQTAPVTQPVEIAPAAKTGKKGWLWVAIIALVAALGIGVFGIRKQEEPERVQAPVVTTPAATTQPEETIPPVATQPAVQEPWRENVLVYDPISVCGIDRTKIRTVTFYDTLDNAPNTCWDVSDAKNGSVLAWVETNGNYYDLYIAADGGINGEIACAFLFNDCSELREINFNDHFHTDYAKDMKGMFQGCSMLPLVDCGGFNTSKVTDMSWMFAWCSTLTELDVSGFNTSNVTNMCAMFYNCRALKSLDTSGFNTSKVTSVSWMFSGCSKLTYLDVEHFDISNVVGYEDFMDPGWTINDRPWEEFFQ